MQSPAPIVVFCDLDDTLLDARTFCLDASTALARLEREQIPMVFCSSKTRAELEFTQQNLGLHQPFICESGAAVFVPRGYFAFSVAQARDIGGAEVVEFGKPYAEVVACLHRVADRLDIEVIGFDDMSVEDVAIDCDVPLLQARLAKLREYNEPFRFVDADARAFPRLFKALRNAGLSCTSRGRYHHVGAGVGATGAQFLCSLYRRAFGEVVTVAFGDHRSSVSLLRHADIPLVVPSGASDETTCLLAEVPRGRLSRVGSLKAWAEVVLRSQALNVTGPHARRDSIDSMSALCETRD